MSLFQSTVLTLLLAATPASAPETKIEATASRLREQALATDHAYMLARELAGKGPPGDEAAMVLLARLLAPLGVERGGKEAGGGADLGVLHEAGVAILGLHQDSSRYFDVHHTADDTLDKIDPVALRQVVAAYAVAAWVAAEVELEPGVAAGSAGAP
jgi:hypothetical protein